MNTMSIVPSGSWNPRDLFGLFPSKDKTEKVTLHENRDSYLVVAVFPGFIKDEIHINFHNGILNIHASSYLLNQNVSTPRFAGRRNIHRTVHLLGEIDEAQIRYLYERNILKIWLPKKDRKYGIMRRLKLRVISSVAERYRLKK